MDSFLPWAGLVVSVPVITYVVARMSTMAYFRSKQDFLLKLKGKV